MEGTVDDLFSVLLMATEWDTSKGGISSFNMELARLLVASPACVLRGSGDPRRAARQCGDVASETFCGGR